MKVMSENEHPDFFISTILDSVEKSLLFDRYTLICPGRT